MKALFFRLIINILSMSTTLVLILFKWKKKVITINREYCGFQDSGNSFRYKLYFNVSLDFWVFVFRYFPGEIEFPVETKSVLLKMKKSGGVLLSFHYSNYELLAQEISGFTGNMFGAHEPLKNRAANSILQYLRSRGDHYVKYFYGRPWEAFSQVRSGGVFGFMVDQDPVSHFRPEHFFGRVCNYANVPSLIEKRLGVPGYVCYMKRESLKKYVVVCLNNSSRHSTIHFANSVLQKIIEENPTLWYGWTHRRFKSIDSALYI